MEAPTPYPSPVRFHSLEVTAELLLVLQSLTLLPGDLPD